jgi:acid phosphatase type 7
VKKISLLILAFFLLNPGLIAEDDEGGQEQGNDAALAKYAAKLTPLTGTVPAQWRIIWTGDAAREATISWSTAEEGKSHKVYYSISDNKSDVNKYEFSQESQRNGKYSATANDPHIQAFYHHAVIKDLKPSTTYYFLLKSDDSVSKPFYFITAPEKGTGFSIIHGGDSRSGILARCQMNEMIEGLISKTPAIIGFAHGGDYIATGRSWSQWCLWLSQHELTTGKDGRVIPVIPTRGNHDGGPLYKEIFNIALEQPDWHTTTIGNDVAIVTLSTEVPAGGDQSTWLEAELKRLRPQTKWLLTQYHKPLYPAVKKPPPHAPIFTPLFDTYNVDLACESDGHCIKRTIPIRDGKADPTGVTYIGEGGLGVGQRRPGTDRWYLKGGAAGSDHHVMVLDFTDEKLRIRTILLNGTMFDDHSLSVRK